MSKALRTSLLVSFMLISQITFAQGGGHSFGLWRHINPNNLCEGAKSPCMVTGQTHALGYLDTIGWNYVCPSNHPYLYNAIDTSNDGISATINNAQSNEFQLDITYTNWSRPAKLFGLKYSCTLTNEGQSY